MTKVMQNARVLASANALISKTLERIEAMPNKRDGDRSLDDPESQQSLKDVQQLGHLMLNNKLNKDIQ